MYNREDRGVGADPERKSEHRNAGEARRFKKLANGALHEVRNVLAHAELCRVRVIVCSNLDPWFGEDGKLTRSLWLPSWQHGLGNGETIRRGAAVQAIQVGIAE